jgi:hypothetical protein
MLEDSGDIIHVTPLGVRYVDANTFPQGADRMNHQRCAVSLSRKCCHVTMFDCHHARPTHLGKLVYVVCSKILLKLYLPDSAAPATRGGRYSLRIF